MTEREFMLTSVLQCERASLYVDPVSLTLKQEVIYNEMQERRGRGEPLQYILGECDFMGFTLRCDSRALIPRPETELLVDTVVQQNRVTDSQEILELGTGSGNIAVALAKLLPGSHITSIDVADSALLLAQANARVHKIDQAITFIPTCMIKYLNAHFDLQPMFDIIVSNPPYIASELVHSLPSDVQQEPLLALDGGPDGLKFLREVIVRSPLFLKKNGMLCLEIGDGQREDVEAKIVANFPQAGISFYKDYRGTDRIVIVRNT